MIGGAERYALELARHMAAVVPTTLVTFGDRDREARLGELAIHVLGRPWRVRGQRTNPFSLRLLSRLLAADVIHCHQQHVVASSFSALVGRLTGRKVFVSDLGGGGWDVSAYLSTDRWYHGHLHISRYSREVAGHGRLGRAHVIYGGVDTEIFSPPPDGGRTARDRVVFVGRLLPHKGVDVLIDALPNELPLEVIGRPYDERYLADLHELAAGKRVTFRHDCDDDALVEAYRRALCVVLPSVYRTRYGTTTAIPELLGQTLLEGMACGAPAVGTEVASLPEVVEPGKSGLLVPPNDPAALRRVLEELAGDPERVAAMGAAARRRVLAKFRWPAVVERCLAVYGVAPETDERTDPAAEPA